MSFNPNGFYLKRIGNFQMNKKSSSYHFIIQETTVGRHKTSNLLLRGHKSSKDHAVIEFRDGKMFVKDLNSSVGTFVDGRKYIDTEVELQENMIVGFGYNHFLKKHMDDDKSSIYQVVVPVKIEIDDESDCESSDVVIVDDNDSKNIENEIGNEILQNRPISASTIQLENYNRDGLESKNTSNKAENEKNDEFLDNFKECFGNYFQNNQQNENLKESVEKNSENGEKFQQILKRKPSIIITPNVNENLINFEKNSNIEVLSFLETTLKSLNIPKKITSQNCYELVEPAKNLQVDKDILTIAKSEKGSKQNSNDSKDNSNNSLSRLETLCKNTNKNMDKKFQSSIQINSNFRPNDNLLKKNVKNEENIQNSNEISEKIERNTEKNHQNIGKSHTYIQKVAEIEQNIGENIIIDDKIIQDLKKNIYKQHDDQNISEDHEDIDNEISVTAKDGSASLQRSKSYESEEILMEEIPNKSRILTRRNRTAGLLRKRRKTSRWENNHGMLKKYSKLVKQLKKKQAENEPSISTDVRTIVKFPGLNETIQVPEENQLVLRKRSLIQRRKSVFEKQNEMISEKDTITEKMSKIRHWYQNSIKVIDPQPINVTRRGRKRKDSI